MTWKDPKKELPEVGRKIWVMLYNIENIYLGEVEISEYFKYQYGEYRFKFQHSHITYFLAWSYFDEADLPEWVR